MNLWAWIFGGRLCPRCKQERTYVWDPTLEVLCETCYVVARLKFRAWLDQR